MTESDLTKKIVKALQDRGVWAVKIHGGPHQKRGLPDILGCCGGELFGLEVKMPGRERTVTKLQALTLDKIRKAGGRAEVVSSVVQAIHMVFDVTDKTNER